MVKIIQNYTLHEPIGEGEYGKVYRGVDSRTGREVAVKVINVKRFKDNPKLQECTLNEIDVLNKIQSPHIVRFIEILKTINNFYFFYQFCNGGTLDQQIKKVGRLAQPKIIEYLEQLLQAFKVLTANNIMHRDLKPTNIMIHNGKLKLGDFGFCKSLENQRDLAQTMLGSPIYMAPEVLRGEIYTIKADIWSLGVVTYEMAYGFCPFEESSIARLISVLQNQNLSFNKQINPLSQQLEDFIRKCLVKDHFKRISWDQLFNIQLRPNKVNRVQQPPMNHQRVLSQYNKLPKKEFDLTSQKQNKNTASQLKFFKKKSNKTEDQFYVQQLHQNLVQIVKTIDKFISDDVFPEITGSLALKCFKIVQKEHQKLGAKYIKQRIELNDTIFQIQTLLQGEVILTDQAIFNLFKDSGDQKLIESLTKILEISNTSTINNYSDHKFSKLFLSGNLIRSPVM